MIIPNNNNKKKKMCNKRKEKLEIAVNYKK